MAFLENTREREREQNFIIKYRKEIVAPEGGASQMVGAPIPGLRWPMPSSQPFGPARADPQRPSWTAVPPIVALCFSCCGVLHCVVYTPT